MKTTGVIMKRRFAWLFAVMAIGASSACSNPLPDHARDYTVTHTLDPAAAVTVRFDADADDVATMERRDGYAVYVKTLSDNVKHDANCTSSTRNARTASVTCVVPDVDNTIPTGTQRIKLLVETVARTHEEAQWTAVDIVRERVSEEPDNGPCKNEIRTNTNIPGDVIILFINAYSSDATACSDAHAEERDENSFLGAQCELFYDASQRVACLKAMIDNVERELEGGTRSYPSPELVLPPAVAVASEDESDSSEPVDTGTDGEVDASHIDTDGDGVNDLNESGAPLDNCPDDPNPDQADSDGDGIGDECDNCPDISNSDQSNTGGDDRYGDACDTTGEKLKRGSDLTKKDGENKVKDDGAANSDDGGCALTGSAAANPLAFLLIGLSLVPLAWRRRK